MGMEVSTDIRASYKWKWNIIPITFWSLFPNFYSSKFAYVGPRSSNLIVVTATYMYVCTKCSRANFGPETLYHCGMRGNSSKKRNDVRFLPLTAIQISLPCEHAQGVQQSFLCHCCHPHNVARFRHLGVLASAQRYIGDTTYEKVAASIHFMWTINTSNRTYAQSTYWPLAGVSYPAHAPLHRQLSSCCKT